MTTMNTIQQQEEEEQHKRTARLMSSSLHIQHRIVVVVLLFVFLHATATCSLTFAFAASTQNEPTLSSPFQASFENLPHAGCVSLYHRTGRMGCGTLSRTPQRGRLVRWLDANSDGFSQQEESVDYAGLAAYLQQDDSSHHTQTQSQAQAEGLVFVLQDPEYNAATVEAVLKSLEYNLDVMGGILVVNTTASSSSNYNNNQVYNPASLYPQGYNTPSSYLTYPPHSNYPWNPYGDSQSLQNHYGIPTAYVPDPPMSAYLLQTSLQQLHQGMQAFQNGEKMPRGSCIMVEMNYYMGPGGNPFSDHNDDQNQNNDDQNQNSNNVVTSLDCLSWKDTANQWRPQCLPLGGQSVWAMAGTPTYWGINYQDMDQNQRNRRRNKYKLAREDDQDLEEFVENVKDRAEDFNVNMNTNSDLTEEQIREEVEIERRRERRPRELEDNANNNADQDANNNANNNNDPEVILISTSIDSTSQFHTLIPGFNTAASQLLSTLLAAKIIGQVLTPRLEAQLSKRIVFGLFQGEAFGFMGSRRFFKEIWFGNNNNNNNHNNQANENDDANNDYDDSSNQGSFTCQNPVSTQNGGNLYTPGEQACLYPLRPSLAFRSTLSNYNLAGMLAVDQIGTLSTANTLYVHAADGDDNYGQFVSNVLQALSTDDLTIAESDAMDEDTGTSAIPPTPLSSLLSLSGGTVGGVVLSGYNNEFSPLYHSHADHASTNKNYVDLQMLVDAAVLIARAAIALAYDDGSNADNYEAAAQFAMYVVGEDVMSVEDEVVQELRGCLMVDGGCGFLKKYADVHRASDIQRTGMDFGTYEPFASTIGDDAKTSISFPNYYVGVLGGNNGQPFVSVGDAWYGAYEGEEYASDAKGNYLFLNPSLMEASLLGLMNDFLGRPRVSSSSSSGSGGDDGGDGGEEGLVSCSKTSDCANVEYCKASSSSGSSSSNKNANGESDGGQSGYHAVCTGGGVCVCHRAHFHLAMDEAVEPAPGNSTGRFLVVSSSSDNANGGNDDAAAEDGNNMVDYTPLYTEPYWSSSVGVKVYRRAGDGAGRFVAFAGVLVAILSIVASHLFRVKLQKEKLY